jgi:apolipoprotein N-acyltransferase
VAIEARKSRLLLLVLLSAILLPLSLPNDFVGGAARLMGVQPPESLYWGNFVLGLVCIAPVLYAVSLAPTFGFASLLGMVFGGVSTALSSFWLMFFQGFAVWTYGGVIAGYVGFNALLFPFLRGIARLGGRSRPLLLASAWAVYEYFKSVGFLAYPWGLVAYPASTVLPLIQFVDVTGVWGLSFLMALANAVIAELALEGARAQVLRQASFAALLAACALGYGALRLAEPPPPAVQARMLLVQQNMDPWDGGGNVEESLRVNLELTADGVARTAPAPDLAVWSESSIYRPYVENGNQLRPRKNDLVPAVQRMGIPVLFGGMVVASQSRQEYLNAAILLSRDGNVLDTYGKMHPVPFAESIPLYERRAVRDFFQRVVHIDNAWTMGSRYTIFQVPLASGALMRFGVPICFEDAFADLCRGFILRGADLLVNLTNDSWSLTWSSEIQHCQAALFRAVENRRPLVRSTNGGVSGVVDPWGRLSCRMPFFQRDWTLAAVPVHRGAGLTPYTRFGDWFPRALVVALLAVLLVHRARPARTAPVLDFHHGLRKTPGQEPS